MIEDKERFPVFISFEQVVSYLLRMHDMDFNYMDSLRCEVLRVYNMLKAEEEEFKRKQCLFRDEFILKVEDLPLFNS